MHDNKVGISVGIYNPSKVSTARILTTTYYGINKIVDSHDISIWTVRLGVLTFLGPVIN